MLWNTVLPLLLLFEKRPARLAANALILWRPMLFIELPHGQSAAYIEGVKGHVATDRVCRLRGPWRFNAFISAFAFTFCSRR